MKRMQRLGVLTAVGMVTAVALGAVVTGCGESFGGDADCKTRHTCAPVGGAGSDEPTTSAGSGADGGRSGADDGGAGGAGESLECSNSADCDDGDATDGIETCFNGSCIAGNAPPTILSSVPENEAVGVEPDGTIVLQASEALDPSTVTLANIKLVTGEKVVPIEIEYADEKITITPEKPLALLVPYEVSVSSAVTDADGAPLAEPFVSSFKVRDGAWSVTTVVPGSVVLSPSLQLSDDGDALLGWIVRNGNDSCARSVRFYNRGEAMGAIKTLTLGHDQYCYVLRSSVAPNGDAVVSWGEEDGQDDAAGADQFRAGKWLGSTAIKKDYDYYPAAAATSEGVMHYAGGQSSLQMWATTATGAWPKTGTTVAADGCIASPVIAVGTGGKAFATCRTQDAGDEHYEIAVSRYAPDTGTWSAAESLPGSSNNVSGAGIERGEPNLALDGSGAPLLVWRRGSELVSTSYNEAQGSWAGPVTIATELSGLPDNDGDAWRFPDPPALVFDGKTFVVGYSVLVAKKYDMYVARFDRDNQQWVTPELVSDAATAGPERMPHVVSDAYGNLLVVWPVLQSGSTYELAYRRFDADLGVWLDIQRIDGALMKSSAVASGVAAYPLGGNSSGLAALSLADGTADATTNLRLASFY